MSEREVPANATQITFRVVVALLLLAEIFTPILLPLFGLDLSGSRAGLAIASLIPDSAVAFRCVPLWGDREFARAYLMGFFGVTIVVLPMMAVSSYTFGVLLWKKHAAAISQAVQNTNQSYKKALILSVLICLAGTADLLHGASAAFLMCERHPLRQMYVYPVMTVIGFGYGLITCVAFFSLGSHTSSVLSRIFIANK